MNAEAVILGSGTSTGVPILGRTYSDSYLSNPKNHRMRSSLLLRGPTGNVLVDGGPDMRLQLLRENVKELEAVLITHSHADHVMGLDDLRSFTERTGLPVPIYTSPEYQADLRRIFEYAFRDQAQGIMVPRFDLRDVPSTLPLAGLVIHTFWVEHGYLQALGIRVGDFAYLTDVSAIPASAQPWVSNLDVLVIDAVRRKPHPTHMHLEQTLATVAELKPRIAYLTHLSDDYDHDVTEAELPPNVRLAYDGLRIPL